MILSRRSKSLASFWIAFVLSSSLAHAITFRPKTYNYVPPMRNIGLSTVAGGRFFCPQGLANCKPDGVIFFHANADGNDELPTPEDYLRVLGDRGGLVNVNRTHLEMLEAEKNLLTPTARVEFGKSFSGCVGDLNGDGYDDAIAINRDFRHQLWLNAGAIQPGRLLRKTTELNEMAWIGAAPGQLTNVSTLNGEAFRAYSLNQNRENSHNTQARHCAIGDLNRDGRNDIIISHNSVISKAMSDGREPQANSTTLQVFLNQGQGRFLDVSRTKDWLRPADRALPVDSRSFRPLLHDWNQDGRTDILLLGGVRTDNQQVILYPHHLLLQEPDGFRAPSNDQIINLPGENGGLFRSDDVIPLSRFDKRYAVFASEEDLKVYKWNPDTRKLVLDLPAALFVPGDLPLPDFEAGKVTQMKRILRGGLELLVLARQFKMEVYWRELNGLFTKDAQSFTAPPTGSNEDLEVIDVNLDGVQDIIISGKGNSRVALGVGARSFRYSLRYQNRSTMNAQSWGGCLKTDLKPGEPCPFNAYLYPGVRNFAGLTQKLRNLPNGSYLSDVRGFQSFEAIIQMNPKNANLEACLNEPNARNLQADPSALSFFISNCDHPESCTNELRTSCGEIAWNAKPESFRTSCSWFNRREQPYRRVCTLQCYEDCLDTQANTADADLISILEQNPNYFVGACSNRQGACFAQCNEPFLDGQIPPNPAFNRLTSQREIKSEPVTIEEGRATVALDIDGDHFLDIVSEELYQGTHVWKNNGGNQFSLIGPERLPCSLFNREIANGGVQVVDMNSDGNDDLLHIRPEGPLELWLNRFDPVAELGPNPGKLFDAIELRPIGWFGKITASALTVNSFFVGTVANRPEGGQYYVLERWNRPPLALPPKRVGLACKDHRTGQLSKPCPLDITRVRLGDENVVNGKIQSIRSTDINGDGIPDLVLAPQGWREIVEGLLRNPNSGANYFSPVVTLLIGDHADSNVARYKDLSEHVQYSVLQPYGLSMVDTSEGNPINVEVQQVTGINPEDFDGDGDIDLLVTEFARPVYLENLGRKCWSSVETGRSPAGTRCMVDRSEQVFRLGDMGFNGITGLKNYGSTVFDADLDGKLDFVLRSAAEDQVFIQGP